MSLWVEGKRECVPLDMPMNWREPIDHFTYCYFKIVKTIGFNRKNKDEIQCQNLESTRWPIPHNDLFLPIKIFCNQCDQSSVSSPEEKFDNDPMNKSYTEDVLLQEFSHKKLNDLIREPNLSKQLSDLLASRLAEKKLLLSDVKITYYRNREINQ